ncbi:MAG: FKBP-type peptidyl-prolyl cis-trans isomerase [Planctomycetota bacterium]
MRLTGLLIALAVLMSPIHAQESATDDSSKETKPKIAAGPKDEKEKVKPGEVDEDAPVTFTTTDSGLKYRILRKSDKAKPESTQKVEVHYKGWLDDKKIFDSSYRRGRKAKFGLNQVIRGWTEGLQLVGEGGMIELEIPAELGYGERGVPGTIPGGATLHFLVELFTVD